MFPTPDRTRLSQFWWTNDPTVSICRTTRWQVSSDRTETRTLQGLPRSWTSRLKSLLATPSPDWMEPFARRIDAAKKYVVSSTLDRVDWNAELVRGDLGKAVQQLKRESGKGLFVGGVKLPMALAELGLIDEYEFVVQPRLAGHGPTLFAGLSKRVELRLVSRLEFGSGAVAMRYEPRR